MNGLRILSIVVLFSAICFLGYVPEQSDFYKIAFSGFIAFIAYGSLSFYCVPKIKTVFVIGVLIRLILLFAFPNLSDDIYRFVWDGNLISLNINPYGSMPSELVGQGDLALPMDLYSKMNSPDYYTIYPPVTQFMFYISTWFNENIIISSLIIKLFFLTAEIFTFWGIIKLLETLKKPITLVTLYFLNPLILIEGMVNLHFEIIMIVFLIWGIYFLFIRKKIIWGALLITLSIASKLLPLMFLPFFLFALKGKERFRFFIFGFIFMVIAFSPIILGLDLQNFASSIELYFQKFEFNGGVYYLLRYIGRLFSGYNLIHYIGPFLGFITLFLICKKSINQKSYGLERFLEFAFYSFVVYLFLATTIHPWYLSIPILLSVFVRWRFALVWSFLVMLTYINYSYDPYFENLWVVAFEYVIVFGVLIYESKYVPSKKPKLVG